MGHTHTHLPSGDPSKGNHILDGETPATSCHAVDASVHRASSIPIAVKDLVGHGSKGQLETTGPHALAHGPFGAWRASENKQTKHV